MITYYYILVILANCLLLFAFIYGSLDKKLRRDKLIRWYIIYLGFIVLIEITTKSLIHIFHSSSTQSIYPFYVAGEFYFLLQLFLTELKASKKWFTLTIVITMCLFIEAFVLWLMHGDATSGYGKILSHLTIVCMTAFLLVEGLKELKTKNPILIVYAALFFYYAVSLFLFLLMSQMTKTTIIIWSMNNIITSILYCSSIYTFYRLKKL